MYLERMIQVSKAENGYVLEINVPLKPKAKGTAKMECCCCPSTDKQYIAETAEDVAELVKDIMPLLDADYTSEDDFDKAFAQATKNISDDEKKEGEEK